MEYITVPERFIGQADFAVRISGNSLEPIYFDGDLILAKSMDRLKHGDLGVFIVAGEGCIRRFYCKAGEQRLVSLNIDISDVALTTDVVCKGRVIGRAIGRK